LTEQPPSQTFFPELHQRFSEPGAWRIYEDVLPALKTLGARGFRLGVISNWDDRLRPLLGRLGLANHFQTIVVSCEAGAAKPAPAIFQKAARQLGVEETAVLHVGDSLEMDLQAAQSAGWSAVQIIRKGVRVGDWQVASLLDLTTLI
jgi:putative hydrolase of the HAD superfamily